VLKIPHFLPLTWIHSTIDKRIRSLEIDPVDARRNPALEGTSESLQPERAAITHDAPESGGEVRNFQMQLANSLALAAKAATAARQGQEDKGQKYSDPPDCSRSDCTQLSGWITQLWIVIGHQPGSFPHAQSKIRYTFNCQRGGVWRENPFLTTTAAQLRR